MISEKMAIQLFEMWIENNDPITFFKKNGVTENGMEDQDFYHCISMDMRTGAIIYRRDLEPDHSPSFCDLYVMHYHDDFDILKNEVSKEDCIDFIHYHYIWAKCGYNHILTGNMICPPIYAPF